MIAVRADQPNDDDRLGDEARDRLRGTETDGS
jgi:hypothetical protein